MTQTSLPFSGRTSTSRANSLQSSRDAAHYAGRQAQKVLRVIREAGCRGSTDWDVIAITSISRSSVCARRNALMDAGLVVEHPDTAYRSRVAGPWGRRCTVYVSHDWTAKVRG